MHDVTWQNVAARNDHYAKAFVRVHVVNGNDVLTFDFASWYHSGREIQRKKYDYFNALPAFSVIVGCNRVKCKNNDHMFVSLLKPLSDQAI